MPKFCAASLPALTLEVGRGPLNNVGGNEKEPRDSELSDTDRAALEFAKSQHLEAERRKWLFGWVAKGAKWVLAIIGFGTVVADAARGLWNALR